MTRLGIVTGMAFEADILHAAAERLAEAQRPIIVCHGFGRSASRRAALEAISLGAEALLSFGIAGGLDPQLKAGCVIAATSLRDGTNTIVSDPGWTARLRERIEAFAPRAGVIAHGARVLTTPAEKRLLRDATHGAAVDMESFGIAEIAAAKDLPFTALRVIADTADDSLPEVAVAAATPDGHVAVMRSVMGALTHPQQIPALIWLGRRTHTARGVMTELADLGLARSFFV
jgi:hopanoid-associated phosphorylase